MVFEIRLLKTIFGFKMQEVTGDWRKLCSGKCRNLLSRQVLLAYSSHGG